MIYILPLSKVIKQFTNINYVIYVIYADDIQLYWKVPTVINNVPNELTLCTRNVRKWLILNNLFSNSYKTKLLKLPLNLLFFILLPLILQLSFQVIMLNLLE